VVAEPTAAHARHGTTAVRPRRDENGSRTQQGGDHANLCRKGHASRDGVGGKDWL